MIKFAFTDAEPCASFTDIIINLIQKQNFVYVLDRMVWDKFSFVLDVGNKTDAKNGSGVHLNNRCWSTTLFWAKVKKLLE